MRMRRGLCAPACRLASVRRFRAGVLPASLEVEFDLVLVPRTADGLRVRRKIQVAIDGDWVLNVRLTDESDPFSLEIASASS